MSGSGWADIHALDGPPRSISRLNGRPFVVRTNGSNPSINDSKDDSKPNGHGRESTRPSTANRSRKSSASSCENDPPRRRRARLPWRSLSVAEAAVLQDTHNKIAACMTLHVISDPLRPQQGPGTQHGSPKHRLTGSNIVQIFPFNLDGSSDTSGNGDSSSSSNDYDGPRSLRSNSPQSIRSVDVPLPIEKSYRHALIRSTRPRQRGCSIHQCHHFAPLQAPLTLVDRFVPARMLERDLSQAAFSTYRAHQLSP